MADFATRLPGRRPELVRRPFGKDGSYLVRDRRAGESFVLGPEEYFLLARLDGTPSAGELRAAFAERFGELLTEEELDDFLRLARQHGLLQEDGDGETRPDEMLLRPAASWETAMPEGGRRCMARGILPRRLVSLFLGAAASAFQWLGDLLEGAAGRILFAKFARFDFVPRRDDVFIVTYPRSGTTWMQMILYQLTTEGSMDFPHIYEYCPWFEDSGRSAGGFEGRPSPRLFKSHLPFHRIPKGPCKYIYVVRNGRDVAVSYYHFYRSHYGYRGGFGEFFDLFLRGQLDAGSWFAHVKGWWQHRHDPNVLCLRYEELLADPEGSLRKIIAFCGLNVPEERFPSILQRCSFSFMKQHESQFDPVTGQLWEQGVQPSAFLRRGRAGEGKQRLSPQQAARFERVFQKNLGATGIDFRDV